MKWSSNIRKWSRLIHRDLSFFFSGMVLIYAISGIVMNHRDTINPNFSITRKEYKIAEKLPDKAGVHIMGGVTIGRNSVIGAGSVVTKDVPENVIAAGVPCKVIREITDKDKTDFLG